MEIAYIVVFLGLLIFMSHLFNSMFDRTRIPNAFLLLIIGIIVGPATSLIKPEFFGELGRVFTTITLIVILFESGLSLKFTDLRRAIGTATFLTLLNFVLAMGMMAVLFYYLTDLKYMEDGRGWISAFFLGAILGGTSSAVVIPMVRQLKLGEKSQTVLVLESALSDVLCLVIGLALLDSMKAWEVDFQPLFHRIWQMFLFAILIGLYAGLLWIFIKQRLVQIKESLFSTFAFAFIVYGLTELAGFNGGIATLAFGITMGNAQAFTAPKLMKRLYGKGEICVEQNEQLFYTEIVFILQTYFFVYIGINIRFGDPVTYLIAILAVVLNILMRVMTVRVLPKGKLSSRDRAVMSIMSPKGLVPAVLASIPLYMGIEGGETIQEITYAIVFTSILICSLLVMFLENKYQKNGAMQGAKVAVGEEVADDPGTSDIQISANDSNSPEDHPGQEPEDDAANPNNNQGS